MTKYLQWLISSYRQKVEFFLHETNWKDGSLETYIWRMVNSTKFACEATNHPENALKYLFH